MSLANRFLECGYLFRLEFYAAASGFEDRSDRIFFNSWKKFSISEFFDKGFFFAENVNPRVECDQFIVHFNFSNYG